MVTTALLALLLFLPYLVPLREARPLPSTSPYPNGFMVEVCGIRWHGQVWQAQPAPKAWVLLLHGFSGSTFSFRHVGPALAEQGFSALAVDIPPFGWSQRSRPQQDEATCLAQLLRSWAGQAPVVVMGHSMGAPLAAAVAAELGSQVQAVVAVAGPLGAKTDGSSWRKLMALPPLGRWAEVVSQRKLLKPESFARTLASAYGRDPQPEEVAGYREPLLVRGTAKAVFRQLPWRGRAGASLDQLPILLLWGREDRWVPPRVAESTKHRWPHAQLVWIEGAGHCPMETHPEVFLEHLLSFLGALFVGGNTVIS
ncbi:MAG: alpha/beta hydrolase [Thermoanaerobaculum sp.]|nr:alpha/beta hydrolase [Thermoanaerobaculum sp.]